MPAERINVSFAPRPLEVLYSKYASINNNNNNNTTTNDNKLTSTNGHDSVTCIKPTPSLIKPKNAGGAADATNAVPRRSRLDAPVRFPRRQELGDLRKLGRELTKVERVQMLLDLTDACHVCSSIKTKSRSLSQPNSAGTDRRYLNKTCQQCSEEHKREEGRTKLRNLKSKLRLVAARSLPECSQQPPSQLSGNISSISTSPAARTSVSSFHRVVPLPLLQLGGLHQQQRRHMSSSEDLAMLRDARHSLRQVLMYPMPSISRRIAVATSGQNYRGLHADGAAGIGSTGRHHGRSMEQPLLVREYSKYAGEFGDSSEGDSSQMLLLPPAAGTGPPVCSPADDIYETATVSTFDADRLDNEQFEYIFERLASESLTDESDGSTSSGTLSQDEESDTGTFSARAQRPSTTDTVASTHRLVETRASMAHPPMSPASPQQKSRGGGGESWPPQYTVVPSWPSVDDPYRFQYFGCGVHRDIMRRLHRSRGRRRNGKHSRDSDQQQQQPPQPHVLKVVVPSPTECVLCHAYDCHHNNSSSHSAGPTAPHSQAYTASIAGKSAKSRESLSMSVCTVLSRKNRAAASQQQNGSAGIHTSGKAERSASRQATEDAGHQGILGSVSEDRVQPSSVVSQEIRSSVADLTHVKEVALDKLQSGGVS